MELEEALAEIKRLETELSGIKDTHKTEIENLNKDHEKAIQKADNQGYDRAKKAFEKDVKDGYVSKDEVEKILNDRDTAYNREATLAKMGVKNPKKALKLLDEDDLEALGTDAFNEDDFKKKYSDDIVFKNGETQTEEGTTQPPKQSPSNVTKNNSTPETKLTAEQFEAMTPEQRANVPLADKVALL